MLNIYTSTYCRPDYVQLLSYALQKTLLEPYKFIVIVHPEGLRRDWIGVDEIITGTMSGYKAWMELIPKINGPSVILHDDCVPVLPWDSSIFTIPHMIRIGGHTLQYHADTFKSPAPVIDAKRVNSYEDCSPLWSDSLCEAAIAGNIESIYNGIFLHIDKGTIGSLNSKVNITKPSLIKAIVEYLECPMPLPLTDAEKLIHPGKLL